MIATTDDGVRLRLRRFRAAAPRRAVLLCTHAMMANSGYFARLFAPYLTGRGVEVYLLDWRGHGCSRPPSPRADSWGFEEYVERDLPTAVGAVCHSAGVAPGDLAYLGHSLGGLVALASYVRDVRPRPGRLALWATSLWLPGPGGARGRRALMALYDLASRRLGYAPIRALRLGTDDEVRGYVDQLTSWAATGQWLGRDGIDYEARLAAVDVPVWAVNGDGDRLSRAADAQRFLDSIPGALPLRRVGRRSGDLVDADHFSLFLRPELAPLWDELIEFVTQ